MWKMGENKNNLQLELKDINQILKFGSCTESQRQFLRRRKTELERKLEELDERVSD